MKIRGILGGLAASLLVVAPAPGATLLHLDLDQLTQRADRIFRGSVVDVHKGTVKAGGGDLPTVTYRLVVSETFKGEFALVKGDRNLVEIRMLSDVVARAAAGAPQRLSPLRDLPRLEVGKEYLLLMTRPSAIGLSTTVGLGQGRFEVFSAGKDEVAVNAFNNAGLLPAARASDGAATPARGPIAYPDLARRIRALVQR